MVTTMSIKEIVEAEKSNASKIYLYREGLFFVLMRFRRLPCAVLCILLRLLSVS